MIPGLIILYILLFFLGASLGSFCGVLLDRLPRKESIISPPSHCTNCEHHLAWYENIPLISYIFLGGKCKNCHVKIPFKFFIFEFLSGVVFLIISIVILNQFVFK